MDRSGRTTDTAWVSLLAEQLICEIADQMGAIRLSCEQSASRDETSNRKMSVISAEIGGDYNISIYFLAEHSLFLRLARNMLGEEPGEEDVRIYVGEFFNIVCGRFISELGIQFFDPVIVNESNTYLSRIREFFTVKYGVAASSEQQSCTGRDFYLILLIVNIDLYLIHSVLLELHCIFTKIH